jgi:hypothetical protein
MLLVNARKGPSQIHGLGLIAHEFIPKGTRIWEFREGFDLKLTEEELAQLPSHAREQVVYYSYFDPRSGVYVVSMDDDRFTNHSNEPNVGLDDDGVFDVALRDIYPEEEITWDYRPWLSENHAHIGSPGSSRSRCGCAPTRESEAPAEPPMLAT